MGITHIPPSDEDRRIAALRLAHLFRPNSVDMLDAANELIELLPDLIATEPDNLPSTLVAIKARIKEIQSLSRGHSTILKPFEIVADSRYCMNLTTSLLTALRGLAADKVKAECLDLHTRINRLVVNVTDVVTITASAVEPQPPQPVAEESPEVIDELFDAAGLEQFAHYADLIPGADSTELAKPLELPVMVTFNRFATVEELTDRGFQVEGVSGYIVMKGAHFIAINTKRCNAEGLDEEKVLGLSLTKLTEKLGRLGLVREQGVRANKGGWMLYWYGTASYINALRGPNIDNPLIVTDYQFPFGGYNKQHRHQPKPFDENNPPKRRAEDAQNDDAADTAPDT